MLQNVITGDDVDITMFPAPQWHEADGGRYIGTGCYSVTRDPDDGWLNQGTYRVMVHDRDSVGIYISPGKHGRMHRDKYAARGERMPMAIVLGGNPMQFLLTGNEIPYGVCEYDVLGGPLRRPGRMRPRPDHRVTISERRGDRARGLDRPGGIPRGGPARRMDRLLRVRLASQAGDAGGGDLPP